MKKKIIILLTLFLCCMPSFSQIDRDRIEKIIHGKKASVGVAILYKDKMFLISNGNKYPLMSVFKFHIAVAALKEMEYKGIALDSTVCIKAEQMHKNTYSPLRERYPDQDFQISYGSLIEYTASLSDNNTCDILIDFVGGISKVEAYIHTLGISDIQLTETEYTMQQNLDNCYRNWSTPQSVVALLKKVYTENVLSQEHFLFLEQAMLSTPTGKNKLRAGLPECIALAHKTGQSGRTDSNVLIGDNDAGIVYLPSGEKCYIAVLIKDSKETDAENASIIADIAKEVYNSLINPDNTH